MPSKIIAFVTVKPGHEEAFEAAARTCVAASRNEAGTLRYDLWREADGERRYVFDELYVDESAIEAHRASDHYKAFGAAARDLAAGRPVVIVSRTVDVAG